VPLTMPTFAIYYSANSWYSIYHPTEERRPSVHRHCSKSA